MVRIRVRPSECVYIYGETGSEMMMVSKVRMGMRS